MARVDAAGEFAARISGNTAKPPRQFGRGSRKADLRPSRFSATGFRRHRANSHSGAAPGSLRRTAMDMHVPAARFFENPRRRQFALRILATHP